jgi:hypothetical protein
MKKILLVATFLTTCIVSQAQIKLGLKAGANFYKFAGNNNDLEGQEPKMRIGIAGA